MHRVLAFLTLCLALWALPCSAEVPKPTLYVPLDGHTAAALAGGSPYPQVAGEEDTILTLVGARKSRFSPGVVGLACDIGDSPLVFGTAGNFRPDEGTCAFWLAPRFQGDNRDLYAAFFGAADWGMLYKYQNQAFFTFGTAKEQRDLYYDCATKEISSWKPDDWHHVAVTWSRGANERCIYLDGVRAGKGPFPYHRPVADGPLFIGAGCTLFPGRTAHARMDEVALWDRPLDEAAIREVFDLGKAGRPLLAPTAGARRPGDPTAEIRVVKPQSPPAPEDAPQTPQGWGASKETSTRKALPLDGWWHFLPLVEATPDLPAEGWGRARVPGYWTNREDAVGPDGKPLAGRWAGRPLSLFRAACYQRSFTPDAALKGKALILHLDGVDGLADVLLNGRRIGRLPAWEDEEYDVGSLVQWGKENTLTLVLHAAGSSRPVGIYGSVSLQALPRASVKDVVVQPLVELGKIAFSCDVRSGGAADAQLELLISPAADPGKAAARFVHPCRLEGAADTAPPGPPNIGGAWGGRIVQRVECAFVWKDAHPWTYDDPFLYRVRARLLVGGAVVDEAPPVRFGYREFTRRGSNLLLNGKPTHLRGHQIDLAWSDQMTRVKELKRAGMNCFEFSGPVGHDWYSATPYRLRQFEEILDYADENGLVALPILPDAKALRERLFDPEVAALYRRRIEKHVRRFRSHASIGMWFMHFNLAGYRWYVAPDKVDGSHKPTETAFQAKERYALEAERIARTVDPRPLYHHACGNLGSIFTNNCYIGPTSPLQEREEWPSRWAGRRPFPLMAVEHGLMLIPYWFRERKFPLSDVYASEPLFDEIAAITLGRRAYASLTPELFDLYDVGRAPRGTRMRNLIRAHPGYQEVKATYARRSLRAWRTYGVSAIIFNAENWDFWDAAGNPSPVLKAFGRYFGDTDLYVAGPAGDWPSKDHAFFSGERIRKQVVLLNDLTRDLPVSLGWRLVGPDGKAAASGKLEATARAGQPTFIPFEVAAPSVAARTRFSIAIDVLKQPGKELLPESFAVEVFPREASPAVAGRVLLFDPVGRTAEALRRAGIAFEALDEKSGLAGASLLVVGRESYGDAFTALAGKLGLERAIREGLNVLLFEQTAGTPFGLKLQERSTRQAFIASPGHPFLAGLAPEDLADLRGESDLIPAYPPAAPETERQWPPRFHKWGNRGVLSTFALRKPHRSPFVPVLECGFDLTDSPLMEARFGAGRVALCQVDVTSRLGADPAATRLARNLVRELSQRGKTPQPGWAALGEAAATFLAPFGIRPEAFDPERSRLVAVGAGETTPEQTRRLEDAAQRGATVLLLPGAAPAFGLRLKEERLFIGRAAEHPLLAGLGDADLTLKEWRTLQVADPGDGWECIAQPGLAAVKQVGQGRAVACQLDPAALGSGRGRVKALRFWSTLLANLGGDRAGYGSILSPAIPLYEESPWEEIPPYINW